MLKVLFSLFLFCTSLVAEDSPFPAMQHHSGKSLMVFFKDLCSPLQNTSRLVETVKQSAKKALMSRNCELTGQPIKTLPADSFHFTYTTFFQNKITSFICTFNASGVQIAMDGASKALHAVYDLHATKPQYKMPPIKDHMERPMTVLMKALKMEPQSFYYACNKVVERLAGTLSPKLTKERIEAMLPSIVSTLNLSALSNQPALWSLHRHPLTVRIPAHNKHKKKGFIDLFFIFVMKPSGFYALKLIKTGIWEPSNALS